MKTGLISILIFVTLNINAQSFRLDEAFKQIAFNNYEEPIETAFKWISNNITYDIQKLNKTINSSKGIYRTKTEIVNDVLFHRKGVCEDFANLFSAFLDKLNIDNQLISGYIKNNEGIVQQDIGHLWIAAKVNGKWQLFDPTWSSGYIDARTNKFVKSYDAKWFKISPHLLIQSHYPYDPMFQFLDHPKTPKEFYHGAMLQFEKPFFNYNDSLKNYLNMNEEMQLRTTKKRMENVGALTNLEKEYLEHLESNIAIYKHNKQVAIDNKQVDITNAKINKMNSIVKQLNDVRNNFLRDVNSYAGKILTRKSKNKLRIISKSTLQNVHNLNSQLKAIKTDDKRLQDGLNENLKSNQIFIGKIEDYLRTL